MTGDIQAAKQLVWELWNPIAGQRALVPLPDRRCFSDDLACHVSAPIGELFGPDAVCAALYRPLARSFPVARRDAYVFLGGSFEGATWVAATGELIGEMRAPLWRVPTVRGEARVRFGEFYRVEGGQICEIRCLFDLVGLAAQAGHRLLPDFARMDEHPRGPALANGVSLDRQDPATSAATLQLVEDMLGGCNRLVDGELRSMGMDAYWHDDMVWHGPWGVGSAHGFDEFQRNAQGPSVASFPNRRGGFHRARIADGLTAAFTGWPSLRGDFTGAPFRGIEPTGGPIGQNIMDFYVRRGERLHENWVLIDLIDFAAQCGVDLLDRLPELNQSA